MSVHLVLLSVIVATVFKVGQHVGHRWCDTTTLEAAAPSAAPTTSPELTECLDGRRKEMLDYVTWRGKHAQQLEACTASLGEATRALARRRP